MQTDRDLQNLAAEITFLPELAGDWEEEAAINRLDWQIQPSSGRP